MWRRRGMHEGLLERKSYWTLDGIWNEILSKHLGVRTG
jgi:hypothetical protein